MTSDPPSMRPSVSFITLVVRDVPAATAFYAALGLRPNRRSGPGVGFFQLNGLVLALCAAEALGEAAAAVSQPQAVLSHNVDSPEALDRLLARALAAGGQLRVPKGPTPWGGQRAWFSDPDGHLWELVHNPRIHRDGLGGVWLDPPEVSP